MDVIPLNWYNETLTANREKKLELDAVNGNVAGFVVYVKKTGSTNENDGRHEYVSLGNDATLDLLDSGSQSLWGNGVALPAQYLKNELWVNHFENDYNKKKNFYLMPFGTSMKSAYHGVVDGYVKMNGERNYIAITPSEEGVKRKFNINLSVVNDPATWLPTSLDGVDFQNTFSLGGVYGGFRLGFGGHTTDFISMTVFGNPFYQPTETDLIRADIKAKLEELPSFKNFYGTRLTCNVTLVGQYIQTSPTNNWGFSIEIDQPVDYPNGEKITIAETDMMADHRYRIEFGDNVNYSYITSRVSVDCVDDPDNSWREGFETGQYDITAYALVYKHIHNYKGKLTVEQD